MARKRHTPEEIIGKLREAEVLISRIHPAGTACFWLA
jgi:hypothetical protein